MANIQHSLLGGLNLHDAFHYVQATDPGAVGAGLYWLSTNSTPYILNRRDATNTVWTQVAGSGVGTIDVMMGGSGSAISSGFKGDLRIDASLTITGWQIYADTSGSLVVDIWKSTHASFPPTGSNSIVGAGVPPTLSAADHSQFANLTGWTTTVAAGSILRFNVNSASSVTRATLALQVIRS